MLPGEGGQPGKPALEEGSGWVPACGAALRGGTAGADPRLGWGLACCWLGGQGQQHRLAPAVPRPPGAVYTVALALGALQSPVALAESPVPAKPASPGPSSRSPRRCPGVLPCTTAARLRGADPTSKAPQGAPGGRAGAAGTLPCPSWPWQPGGRGCAVPPRVLASLGQSPGSVSPIPADRCLSGRFIPVAERGQSPLQPPAPRRAPAEEDGATIGGEGEQGALGRHGEPHGGVGCGRAHGRERPTCTHSHQSCHSAGCWARWQCPWGMVP